MNIKNLKAKHLLKFDLEPAKGYITTISIDEQGYTESTIELKITDLDSIKAIHKYFNGSNLTPEVYIIPKELINGT